MWQMDQPEWTQVVNLVYKQDNGMVDTRDLSNDNLLEGYDLTESEAQEALRRTWQAGLLEQKKGGDYRLYTLTKEGFQVAHDQNQNRVNRRYQYLLSIFTAVLAFTAFAELGLAAVEYNTLERQLLGLGFVVIVGVCTYLLIRMPEKDYIKKSSWQKSD